MTPSGTLWRAIVAPVDKWCLGVCGGGDRLGGCARGAILSLDGGVGQVLMHPLYPNLYAVLGGWINLCYYMCSFGGL